MSWTFFLTREKGTYVPGEEPRIIRLIEAIIEQLHSIPIFGQLCEGTRIDTGTPEGYREAVKILG